MTENCGNCFKWMKKSLCPLEKMGGKPSCNHWPCTEYLVNKIMEDLEPSND